jgi:hypothetical protein
MIEILIDFDHFIAAGRLVSCNQVMSDTQLDADFFSTQGQFCLVQYHVHNLQKQAVKSRIFS